MTKNVIITGGCGFIGHHVVEHFLINTDYNIIIIDKLNYSCNGSSRLNDNIFKHAFNENRLKLITWDLENALSIGVIKDLGDINIIIHIAAETHVDNSIKEPIPFIKNNIMSTLHLLEYARNVKNLELFFYFSTDEVYGPALGNKLFKEDERHNPTNPYSASKSSAEQICISYHNTYKIPLIRINVMNAFGEKQYVEKFIPKIIKSLLHNEKIYIHAYPDKKKAGTRFYIHARNIAAGVLFLIKNGKIGESYNLTGEKEISNLEIAQIISKIMDKELIYEMISDCKNRPGHDLRYGLDGTKMTNMGWKLPVNFDDSLKKTIDWTLENKEWLEEF